MRAILATVKPVIHVPLGIAAMIIAMVSSIAIALSSPYPHPKARWMIVNAMPKIVVASIPSNDIDETIAGLSLVKAQQPRDVRTLAKEEQPQDARPIMKEEQPQEVKPMGALPEAKPIDAVAEAKAFLAKTAYQGGSISMQGREKAIACFHPQFALNLAATIRDARQRGFPEAAVFSGCRPPRLGIGGFKNKKNSLHGVGLAADIHGIGRPCSAQAKKFHQIAASHGVAGVYGPCNRAEWNHVQGTQVKMTTPALRETFTAKGDTTPNLQHLWSIENAIVLAIATPIMSIIASAESRHSGERTHARRHHEAKRHRHARRHTSHRTAERRHRRKHVARSDG